MSAELRELAELLRAEVVRVSALLEQGGGDQRPIFSLDGVLCATCDGFGHDAPDCPTGKKRRRGSM